ncbi:predicted protein [Sclerotinia sclerotiorum 1980 UF-70]|uniref:Uncharacterized protein n=1 Tax=Sclerotinia sclerotiorum (strain ATCC 18683 / 1980 / Ss-1) TaxID=665079 RepID=A7E5M7_SCLS1|nr:predicted protein [Sclerotinia sclerotiorum 1980 UF-70]EDN91199.1 predicted protein [Sclerotinia sclerotiorum 1980 UF-70]
MFPVKSLLKLSLPGGEFVSNYQRMVRLLSLAGVQTASASLHRLWEAARLAPGPLRIHGLSSHLSPPLAPEWRTCHCVGELQYVLKVLNVLNVFILHPPSRALPLRILIKILYTFRSLKTLQLLHLSDLRRLSC